MGKNQELKRLIEAQKATIQKQAEIIESQGSVIKRSVEVMEELSLGARTMQENFASMLMNDALSKFKLEAKKECHYIAVDSVEKFKEKMKDSVMQWFEEWSKEFTQHWANDFVQDWGPEYIKTLLKAETTKKLVNNATNESLDLSIETMKLCKDLVEKAAKFEKAGIFKYLKTFLDVFIIIHFKGI